MKKRSRDARIDMKGHTIVEASGEGREECAIPIGNRAGISASKSYAMLILPTRLSSALPRPIMNTAMIVYLSDVEVVERGKF